MKEVFRRIRERTTQLGENPLFSRWLESPEISPDDKFVFMPMALDFIMGFRDFNKYFVRYPDPKNPLEKALNEHAAEDETHSLLLLQDWATLGMDERLGWKPRDLYWWLTCDQTRESRRVDFELMSMVYHHPDPLLRFAIIESMEAAGALFFKKTVLTADILEAKLGKQLPYFGRYHLERETGHLQGADEGLFFKATLDDETRERAHALVDRVFQIFDQHFTEWERYGRAVVEKRFDYDPSVAGRVGTSLFPVRSPDVCSYMSLDYPRQPTGVTRELCELRTRGYNDLWFTPFHRWVRQAWPGDFRRMIRYFLLQWVVDNWACADYFAFDTTYAQPRSPLERGINRLSAHYASEMKRRYVEWETLQLDEYTGWSAAEALRHFWVDERVEEHREVFANLRKLTLKYPKPLHRYWIMKCFVRFGDTLMHSLGMAMNRAHEKEDSFITFAGKPERLHPTLPPDVEADLAVAGVEHEELSAEDVAIMREIIAETKAQEAQRSAISWRIVGEKRFEKFDRRWAATRASAMELGGYGQ